MDSNLTPFKPILVAKCSDLLIHLYITILFFHKSCVCLVLDLSLLE